MWDPQLRLSTASNIQDIMSELTLARSEGLIKVHFPRTKLKTENSRFVSTFCWANMDYCEMREPQLGLKTAPKTQEIISEMTLERPEVLTEGHLTNSFFIPTFVQGKRGLL